MKARHDFTLTTYLYDGTSYTIENLTRRDAQELKRIYKDFPKVKKCVIK